MRLGDVEITAQQAGALLRWLDKMASSQPRITKIDHRIMEALAVADRPLPLREIVAQMGGKTQYVSNRVTWLYKSGKLDRVAIQQEHGPPRYAYMLPASASREAGRQP